VRRQSQSHITATGQLDSLSWRQDTIWNPCPTFFSLERCSFVDVRQWRGQVCSLQMLTGLAHAVFLASKFHGTHDLTLLYQFWDSLNLEGQAHIFISHSNRVAQLYPMHWVLESGILCATWCNNCCLEGWFQCCSCWGYIRSQLCGSRVTPYHMTIYCFYSVKIHWWQVNTGNVRFEVFTAVTMKNAIFWDVMSCGSCKNRRFGGT
jgi:hypothetical protein